MSEIDSGYIITDIRSLGNDLFKITLINDTTNDGFAINVQDYSTIEDGDFDDMMRDAVDSRLDELEAVLVDQAERIAEGAPLQGRKGNEAKKTDTVTPAAPTVSNVIPLDATVGVSIDITELYFIIDDVNHNRMDWSVTTTPIIGSGSDTNVGDGQYSIPVSSLNYSEYYEWTVTVDDGNMPPTVETYSFTTMDEPPNYSPAISNMVPVDGATEELISITEFTFDIIDPEGDSMDYNVITTPNVGTIIDTGVGSGQYSVPVSGLAYATLYSWEVTVTDGVNAPVIGSYSFTTMDAPQPPVVVALSPSDGAVDIPISTTLLDFSITDPDAGQMSYTVVTSPDIGTDSDVGAVSGSYNVAVSGLLNSTLYTWTVTADDGITTPTVAVYTFTTEA